MDMQISHETSGLTENDTAELRAMVATLPLRWTAEVNGGDDVAPGEPPFRFARLEPAAEGMGLAAYGIDRDGPAVTVGTVGRDGEAAESDWGGSFQSIPDALAGIAAHITAQLAAWGVQPIPAR